MPLSEDETLELIQHALYEIAQDLGDSLYEPVSLSVLFLKLGIPYDAQAHLMLAFRELSKGDYSALSDKEILQIFRNKMIEVVPQAANFNDLTIYAFIRIMGKTLVEGLYPLSCDLQASFAGKAEIYE